jgi:polyhydroxyalkanoate synthesis repressor PhaR
MAEEKQPTVIKKYANRRLYNTGTSTYVTLEDLAVMVKAGEDFVVFDAKSGDDITRSVLAQIIFEQEGKVGQNLLPIAFLRQLIRFYGDSIQTLVPSYLEFSIGRLTADQQKFREQLSQTLGTKSFPLQVFGAMEEQARKNMQVFTQALNVFSPFPAQAHGAAENGVATGEGAAAAPKSDGDLEEMRRQLQDMQKQIETLARKN